MDYNSMSEIKLKAIKLDIENALDSMKTERANKDAEKMLNLVDSVEGKEYVKLVLYNPSTGRKNGLMYFNLSNPVDWSNRVVNFQSFKRVSIHFNIVNHIELFDQETSYEVHEYNFLKKGFNFNTELVPVDETEFYKVFNKAKKILDNRKSKIYKAEKKYSEDISSLIKKISK